MPIRYYGSWGISNDTWCSLMLAKEFDRSKPIGYSKVGCKERFILDILSAYTIKQLIFL